MDIIFEYDWCEKCFYFNPVIFSDKKNIVCRHMNICNNAIKKHEEKKEKNKWIPVENGLPTSFEVLVTILDESGDTPYSYVTTGCYHASYDIWIVDGEVTDKVIAWCSMPAAYEDKKDGDQINARTGGTVP